VRRNGRRIKEKKPGSKKNPRNESSHIFLRTLQQTFYRRGNITPKKRNGSGELILAFLHRFAWYI
jgi:hypothetical protein